MRTRTQHAHKIAILLVASFTLVGAACGDDNDSAATDQGDTRPTDGVAEPGLDVGQNTQLVVRFEDQTPIATMEQVMSELAPPGEPPRFSLSLVSEQYQILVGSMQGELGQEAIDFVEDVASNHDEIAAVDHL
jgi:hypothetical protein